MAREKGLTEKKMFGKASMMVMRGREMPGWLRVETGSVRTKAQLAAVVRTRGPSDERPSAGRSPR